MRLSAGPAFLLLHSQQIFYPSREDYYEAGKNRYGMPWTGEPAPIRGIFPGVFGREP